MKRKPITVLILLCISLAVLGAAQTSFEGTAEAGANSVRLPVLMYHNILISKNGTYTVKPEQLEKDLAAIKREGYTTVFPSEVIAFVKGKGNLPQKPIMLTFDDGYYNNMYYALPLLKKYNMKATLNIIGAFSEYSTESGDHSNPNYPMLPGRKRESLRVPVISR